jgi:type II restriction enzyme
MATAIQKLGDRGEALVRRHFACLKCKRTGTLKPLIKNFKCADIICDFCGYLAQVKTNRVNDINTFPKSILGAGWLPQKERMDAGIFFSIFFVLIDKQNQKNFSIFYLAAELQNEKMFVQRPPLKETARRAGWQGYLLNGDEISTKVVRLK